MKEVLKIAVGTFIGVTTSSLLIIVIISAVANYEMQQSINAMNQFTNQIIKNNTAAQEETRQANERTRKEQQLLQQARQKLQQEQQKHRESAIAQADKTCNYWKEQEAKENTTQNRIHRENACALVFKMRTGEAWR